MNFLDNMLSTSRFLDFSRLGACAILIDEFIEVPIEGLGLRIVVGPVETPLDWQGVESGEVLPHVVHLVGILIVGLVEVEVHSDLVLGAGLEVWKETLELHHVLQIFVQSEQM